MSNISFKKISARSIAVTAMLSAVAFVLMYIETAIPIIPSYIKLDLSDLPALIGTFALGPIYGVIIELIKNLLHLVVSQSMFVGELSNFILGAVFVFVAGLIYKLNKTKKGALIGGVAGALVMGIVSVPSNYFIVYPVYIVIFFKGNVDTCVATYQVFLPSMKNLLQCLLCFNLPFTIVKGLISVAITMLIYKRLSPILKGKH